MYEINTVGFFISRAQATMRKRFIQGMRAYDITPEEWVLFAGLSEENGISATDISKISLRDKPYTSRLLDKMERKGLIRREENKEDGRSSLIYLTKTGAAVQKEVGLLLEKMDRWAMKAFNAAEIEQLKGLLNKLYDHIKF